ncbi:MAG: protoporphyrinogen oxidase [Acidobacteria bacterium]|nr:protoporphyrinogen oxidase [Acidobacteriota bacterium]
MSYSLSIRRVAILGGGISGLTAAYALARAREAGAPIEEFLIEGSQRLGGVIQTEHVDGFIVEGGPDSFISEKPEAAELCRELGLGDSLMGSNDTGRRTYILHKGKLEPLPNGLMMLVPTHMWPLMNSALLPFGSKVGILAEWFSKPRAPGKADESVASFVRRHFGSAMLDNIVEPLLAGVYGGDSASLSVTSVLPRFVEMERVYGSLVRAGIGAGRTRSRVSKGSKAPAKPEIKSLFMTLKGGLGQLITAIEGRLDPARVHLGRRVIGIERVSSNWRGPYRISCEGSVNYDVDAVVLALPAHECAKFLPTLHPGLAKSFDAIPYSSAVTVTLGFDPGVAELPPGFGFLVPKKENRQLLACTFVHRKFRDRVPEGKAMLRCFLGGARDPEVLQHSDEEILKSVWRELCSILILHDEPLFWRISRWPSAMAQYTVGHQDRVDRIMGQLGGFPRLFPAGNAYSGIGLSDCIRTARNAVKQVLEM